MGRTAFWVAQFAGLSGFFLVRYVFDVQFETMLAAGLAILIATAIGYPVGLLVGHFVSRDGEVDTTPYRVVAGANLVAWVFPVAGMTLSAITWQFSRRSDTTSQLYWWLSLIGGLLALVSAGVGGALEMSDRGGIPTPVPFDSNSSSTERSPQRCAYAAVEQWPNEDFERHCRLPN